MRASLIVGGLFVAAGCLHFVQPQPYRKIVPPMLGHQAEIVVISGLAEIAGGVGLCLPQTRRAAGIGLVALLVAVWPANIYMAVDPAWALWSRVALQVPLIWLVWRVGR
jgi:uncharacterized membrane protein